MSKKENVESREALKTEHTRLVNEEKRLSVAYDGVKGQFKQLENTYAASKGTFTVSRYGQLKDMIKATASDEGIQAIRNALLQSKNQNASNKGGLGSLLKNAQDFSSVGAEQENAKKSGKGGKMSGFMKKLKNITGFSDEAIADEDVMSNSDLQRDNGRKQRAITRYQMQLEKAASKLETLQRSYQASKKHAPPTRYTELKDMIKDCVAVKLD